MKFNPKKLLRTLNYLPRWAWYLFSFFVAGPIGLLAVYLVFHVLEKMEKDFTAENAQFFSSAPSSSAAAGEEYTVTDDPDIERRWQRTEENAARAHAQPAADHPIGEADSVSEVIRAGQEALLSIRRANDQIPDPQLSAQIDSIQTSCSQILSILEQRPQLLPQLRTFLRYYLPSTLRLLDARARLEHGANTPKAREIRSRISEALGVIDKAFLKQVEALDEYRFIDLESEMDVLRDMMRADGLIDEEKADPDDPFASVLRSNSTGR